MARRKSHRRKSAVTLRRIATLSLVGLAATLPAAHAIKDSSRPAVTYGDAAIYPATSLNPTASIAEAMGRTSRSWIMTAKDRLASTITRFLSHTLPDPRYFSYELDQFDEDEMMPLDDLPSDSGSILDGPGLNWGGSTLEVVRSQAIFLTRSAAFGPRITDEAGLKGFLLPITDFYKIPQDASFATSDASGDPIHACPNRGGPGSRRDVLMDKYQDEDDRRLYSSFHRDSPAQASFTWTHTADNTADAPKPPHNWIALVQRGGGCGFADKVRVAQDLGAVAVIVGDAPSPNWHGGRSGDPNEEGDPGLSGKRLITMFAPGDTSDIHIPSTFVTRPSYLDLERLIEETERDEKDWRKQHATQIGDGDRVLRGLEIVISKDDMEWEWPLIDFGILLLLLPSFMTVITIVVHRIRMVRQRRKERAPELVVLGLPCLIWRGNGQPWEKVEGPDVDPGPGNGMSSDAPAQRFASDDLESGQNGETIPLLGEQNEAGPSQRSHTAVQMPPVESGATSKLLNAPSFLPPGRTYFSTDECAICLCDFVDGDRIRILPCGHIFHRQEVDDWLVRVKKLCPICKRDITVPVPPAPPVGISSSSASPSSSNSAAVTRGEGGVSAGGETQQADAVGTEPAADESMDLTQHLSRDVDSDEERSQDGRQV